MPAQAHLCVAEFQLNCARVCNSERIKHSFPYFNVCQAPSVIMCCSSNRKVVRVATYYCMRAWAKVKTQEKNVILSLLYTFSKSNTFEKSMSSRNKVCFADHSCTRVGFNGINALASQVLTVLQLCDTLLLQCNILKIGICQRNGQQEPSITRPFYTSKGLIDI